jgi:hypothetical protein
VELYEEAVAAGDPAAAATLAMMHRLGRGVPRDPERMIALMQQGADAGYHFAQYRLAQTYLTGEGVPDDALERLGLPNPVAAIPYLAGAARSGNDDAARELADLYATGAPGLTPNPARQFRWTNFLAEKGDAPAMALIAFFYEQGIGVERDPERAAAEYVRALETGGVDPETMRGTVGGFVPPWDQETALAFQAILQERGLYLGRARCAGRARHAGRGAGAGAAVGPSRSPRSMAWYSGFGIMSDAMAKRLDMLKNPITSARSKISSWLSPAARSASRSASTISAGAFVSFHAKSSIARCRSDSSATR